MDVNEGNKQSSLLLSEFILEKVSISKSVGGSCDLDYFDSVALRATADIST